MEQQQNPMKRYTVGALILQTVVLLGLAALAVSGSSINSWDLPGMMAFYASLYLGVLGLVSLWLTNTHINKTMRNRTLQMWACICIILSLFQLIPLLDIYIRWSSIQALASLVPVVIFLIPTILVLIFSSTESP